MMADGRYEIAARLFAVRNGAVLKELSADEMKVICSAEAEIKRSFSCRIRYDAEVDLLTDRLRPVQVIDGREYPLGEFLGRHRIHDRAERLPRLGGGVLRPVAAAAADDSRRTLRFAAGTPYLSAVRSLLAECGLRGSLLSPAP